MHQDLIRPGTLVEFDGTAAAVADLRKFDAGTASCEWRRFFSSRRARPRPGPSPKNLSPPLPRAGLFPQSKIQSGTNLVLWRWHDPREAEGGAALALLDPENTLGANEGQL